MTRKVAEQRIIFIQNITSFSENPNKIQTKVKISFIKSLYWESINDWKFSRDNLGPILEKILTDFVIFSERVETKSSSKEAVQGNTFLLALSPFKSAEYPSSWNSEDLFSSLTIRCWEHLFQFYAKYHRNLRLILYSEEKSNLDDFEKCKTVRTSVGDATLIRTQIFR